LDRRFNKHDNGHRYGADAHRADEDHRYHHDKRRLFVDGHLGQTKLWVSLVLDNTGSMSETDGTGLSKISALKTAATQMLTTLQNASANPGDVQVALVPFTKNVDVGTSLVGATGSTGPISTRHLPVHAGSNRRTGFVMSLHRQQQRLRLHQCTSQQQPERDDNSVKRTYKDTSALASTLTQ